MCGICGFVSKQSLSLDLLKDMNNSMNHRGPNDSGECIYAVDDEYILGLGHKRLSIMDLSMSGHQPMHSTDKSISIVFNGEIYNFKQLKEEMPDYNFNSECDTEVIIAAYQKWGISCIEHFNGMFAIAIFDRKINTLYLVRDRLGIKPLYYWLDGTDIFFASECKPFMEVNKNKLKINTDVLPFYLCNQYIKEPNTIFKNIYKVRAGTILSFKNGNIKEREYWSIIDKYNGLSKKPFTSYEQAKESLRDVLKDAVKLRMEADVPIGVFLSGGYDSTLVAALAQCESKSPINTYSIGFLDKAYNEAEYAKKISEKLGTNHHEFYMTEQDLMDLIMDLPRYYDEPFADSSQLPTMLVSNMAKKDITVALSGDGGDEFFCGYKWYSIVKKAQYLDTAGAVIYHLLNFPGLKKFNIIDSLPYNIKSITKNRDNSRKVQLGMDGYIDIIKKMLMDNSGDIYINEGKYGQKDWIIRKMLFDQDIYLPGDILCKMDRASMKYSLEARSPLLDYRIVELSYKIPLKYKLKNGNLKYILKDIVHDYVPKELMERPKMGFCVPIDSWLRNALREQLLAFSNFEYLEKQGIFNPQATKSLVDLFLNEGDSGSGKRYSRILWSFFIFQLWYEYYFGISASI